jgi:hypothetical protein
MKEIRAYDAGVSFIHYREKVTWFKPEIREIWTYKNIMEGSKELPLSS